MSIAEQDPYVLTLKVAEPFTQALEHLRQSVSDERLELVYDVSLDSPGRSCRVLGVADAALTQKALGVEPNIAVFLPLQITLRGEGDAASAVLAFADPVTVLAIANNPEVTLVAWELRRRMEQVRDRLAACAPTCKGA